METKGICPVVFIGDKIKTCKDINSLFINPFETKLETDKAREKAIMSIYKNCDNTDELNYWYMSRDEINSLSNLDAIITYLITNISDLTMNTLIAFMEESFSTAKSSNKESSTSETTSESIGRFFTPDYFNIDIYKEVATAISVTNINLVCCSDFDFQKLYINMDMCMSRIYSYLVAKIFDPFIVRHVTNALTRNDGLDRLYDLLYYKCYSAVAETYPSTQVEYAFCTSVLREVMEKNLVGFRSGLIMIARSAALMCTNKESNNILKLESINNSEK